MALLTYYDKGENKFKNNVPIYINRCIEQVECHVHAHDYIEIAYVVAGRGLHILDGRAFEVTRGDLFVINYDTPHEFRSRSDIKKGSLIVYNCVFRPEFIDQSLINSRCFSDISHIFFFQSLFNEETQSNAVHLTNEENNEIEELYEKMLQEYKLQKYGYVEILRAYVLELLVKTFRFCADNNSDSHMADKKMLFNRVIEFMKSHYKQEIKLGELAAMAFLSRNYFCKSFKTCTGMTVFEYIQKLRIDQACSLLRETDSKVIDIAEEVGYNDIKFFNKVFKKITGFTPNQYRKTMSLRQ